MLIDEGVQLITIHPRLQRQSYARPALHEYTAALAKDLPIPVYGNGDINSAEKLQTAAQRYPCAGWMIGRAAVQMPWIFEAIRRKRAAELKQGELRAAGMNEANAADFDSGPYRIDLEQTAVSFLQYLETEQPPEFFLTRAQRFFQFYCENFSFAHYCRTQLLQAQSRQEMEHTLHTYFEQAPEDKMLQM